MLNHKVIFILLHGCGTLNICKMKKISEVIQAEVDERREGQNVMTGSVTTSVKFKIDTSHTCWFYVNLTQTRVIKGRTLN